MNQTHEFIIYRPDSNRKSVCKASNIFPTLDNYY